MSYLVCPSCGQKALSVATRCPHCGVAFETGLFQHPVSASTPSRSRLVLFVAGVALVVLAVNTVRQRLSVLPSEPQPAASVAQADPPLHPSDSLTETADSQPIAAPQLLGESQQPVAEAADLAARTPRARPVGTKAQQRRYASTWINVRADRSTTAPVIDVLRPGELVLVELPAQGWYQVVTDEERVGYVDRRYLDDFPTAQP